MIHIYLKTKTELDISKIQHKLKPVDLNNVSYILCNKRLLSVYRNFGTIYHTIVFIVNTNFII